jgi:hypothetical protein
MATMLRKPGASGGGLIRTASGIFLAIWVAVWAIIQKRSFLNFGRP